MTHSSHGPLKTSDDAQPVAMALGSSSPGSTGQPIIFQNNALFLRHSRMASDVRLAIDAVIDESSLHTYLRVRLQQFATHEIFDGERERKHSTAI